MNKLRILLIHILVTGVLSLSFAGEGMWLPIFLKSLNEAEMQSLGMKLTAEDIYNVNKGSLKDAIAHFGGFCTSEVISNNGLLLTNHHCGYRQIQSHTSIDDNILKNGFWAKDYSQEKPNPGLFATFIEQIDDVTKMALKGVKKKMTVAERQSIIDKNIEAIKAEYLLGEFQDVIIRPFFNGNQYFAFKTVTYNDVRLVGTPPEMIGKFGSDTDNWVFPRHTGDFSLFRIYAGPNNEPAEYSEDNKPFTPKYSLPISLDGVEEGDFTMVFGFPGRTNQYLPSPAVEQIINTLNPAKIEIRDRALKIIDKYMRADPEIKIKYASKFASVANYWKKWIGESQGLKSTGALAKKYKYEAKFQDKTRKKYRNILPQFKEEYKSIEPYAHARDVYNEVALRNIEILSLMRTIRRLTSAFDNNGEEGYNNFKARLHPYMKGWYKDYVADIDQEVMVKLLETYKSMLNSKYYPEELTDEYLFQRKMNLSDLAKKFFSESKLTNLAAVEEIFELPPAEAIRIINADPIYAFAEKWHKLNTENVAPYHDHKAKIDSLQRVYMHAQMKTFKKKRFWPDANSTMRVTYGNVNGYKPRDGVKYEYTTYVEGIIEKYKEGDYEFDVPEKLLEIAKDKDYGQYADQTGSVPVCFIGTNHTTGGNSGSPAIDAYGNLVGLNFDRVWEGTMSDINYDPSICRNIMVDTRYILWIIDKFAGATNLIEEMNLVHPKKN